MEHKVKIFTRTMLLIALAGSLILVPEMIRTTFNFFNSCYREANPGHFMLHPSTLVLSISVLALPVLLLFAIFRSVRASIAVAAIMLYPPVYLAFGAYVVKPAGLFPTPALWLVLIVIVVCFEGLMCLNIRGNRIRSNKQVQTTR